MQETLEEAKEMISLPGITPAHAGNFLNLSNRQPRYGDHPCPCRKLQSWSRILYLLQGSPLPMQETFKDYVAVIFYLGDHPCPCRKLYKKAYERLPERGSPLPMQETFPLSFFFRTSLRDHPCPCRKLQETAFTNFTEARITPAHAGNLL